MIFFWLWFLCTFRITWVNEFVLQRCLQAMSICVCVSMTKNLYRHNNYKIVSTFCLFCGLFCKKEKKTSEIRRKKNKVDSIWSVKIHKTIFLLIFVVIYSIFLLVNGLRKFCDTKKNFFSFLWKNQWTGDFFNR